MLDQRMMMMRMMLATLLVKAEARQPPFVAAFLGASERVAVDSRSQSAEPDFVDLGCEQHSPKPQRISLDRSNQDLMMVVKH
jgi:hypothetical protein